MGLTRFLTAVCLAALMADSAVAQSAPAPAPAQPATTAAPASQFAISEGVLVVVNDSVITNFDLRQRALLLIAMTQVDPTPENLPAIERQALSLLIEERLQSQEIANYEKDSPGLIPSSEEVAQEIAGTAQRAGMSSDAFWQYLASAGIRQSTYTGVVSNEIAWSRLSGGRFQSRARPSAAAIDAALRQIEDSASKRQYLIGEIYIDASRVGGQQAALNGASQLVAQMTQGAPFTAVAQQFSAAPSAVRGGDAGWVVEGTVAPAVQQTLDQLQVGELSRPVQVDGGVMIIYMRDKRNGSARNVVQLKQVMIEAPEGASADVVSAATQRLNALRPQLTCDNMLARATSEAGLLGTDLGESDPADLAPQFQAAAQSAQVGSVSEPIRTPLGVHLIAVCGRRSAAADAPSREQVENGLFRQNLATLERRYMRDLREDALIEFKQQ